MKTTETTNKVYASVVTIPAQENIEVGTPVFDRYKNTYTEIGKFINEKDTINSYYENAGKSIAFAKVLSIAIGFEYEGEIRTNIFTGKEKDIINQFHTSLKSDFFKSAKLVTYNSEFFLDMVRFRGRANKISKEIEAPQFTDISNNPWSRKSSIDLMGEVVKSYRGRLSLINGLFAAGLDYSLIVPGEDVFTYYQSGDIDTINQSSIGIIKGLVNLDRFMNGQDEIRSVTSNIQAAEERKPMKVNMFDHMISSGEIHPKAIAVIAEKIKETGRPPEDAVILATAAISHSKDKVDVSELDELKEELGLTQATDLIEVVVAKKNLGAKECKALIAEYKKATKKVKKEVVEQVENYLTLHGKIKQVRTKNALLMLREELLETK